MADNAFFKEIKMFSDSARSLGLQWRYVSVSSGISLSPLLLFFVMIIILFYNNQIEKHSTWHPQCAPNILSLSLSNSLWSITRMLLSSRYTLPQVKEPCLLFVSPTTLCTTWHSHFSPRELTASLTSYEHLIERDLKFAFIIGFNELLTTGGWERDNHLHPDTDKDGGKTTEKENAFSFVLRFFST